MTDEQLDEVEAALGVRLPTAYRRVSREFPFKPIGRDSVYWCFDDPAAVVQSTRYPHEDGGYAGPDLLPRYVVIGQSGAGDLYLLDLAVDGSPVACMSHETHAIEPGWPALDAFVSEWLEAPAEYERHRASEQAEMSAWWHRYPVIAGIIFLFAFVLPLLVLFFASRR